MRIPNQLIRVNDGKKFRVTYTMSIKPEITRFVSDDGETDDLTWVSDKFFVSGSTGHTYVLS